MDGSAEGESMEVVELGVMVRRGVVDSELKVDPDWLLEGLCEGEKVTDPLGLMDALPLSLAREKVGALEGVTLALVD